MSIYRLYARPLALVVLFGLLALLPALPTLANQGANSKDAIRQSGGGVPYKDITSAGPLTNLYLGEDASVQIAYAGDSDYQFYPPDTKPGDGGTLLVVNDNLYAPDFNNHGRTATWALDSYTPFTSVSQTTVTGSGTAANPYKVVTVVDVGSTGLQLTHTDTYVVGEESYRTDVELSNSSSDVQNMILYRAADCYLNESDFGYGYVESNGAVACSKNANNEPSARIEQFSPITPGSSYYEANFNEIWSWINTHQPFPNTCRCDEHIDNGLGLSWELAVPSGGSRTVSHITTFSPLGYQPLIMNKTADRSTSEVGQTNGYTIVIENPNTTAVTLDSIIDELPSGFNYLSGSTSGATSANPTTSGQSLTWSEPINVPAGGTISLHFEVTVSSTAGLSYNRATAEAEGFSVIPTGDTAPITVQPAANLESIELNTWASQETINLGWTLFGPLLGDLDHYEIHRSDDGGNNYTLITSTIDTQYVDDDNSLTQDVSYCYQIKAFDSANNLIGVSNQSCAQFGSLTIWVPEQVVPPNELGVPVTINLANGNGLCLRALDIKLTYDQTIVTANGQVSNTIFTQGYAFEANTQTAGELKISSFVGTGQCMELHGPGTLFDLFFDVIGAEGSVSPLDFVKGLTATVIYDEDDLINPVPVIRQSGSLTIGLTFVRGDVNGDGVVNSADAALALDIASGNLTPSEQQLAACDVNGDSACNSADSSLILCYAAFQSWTQCGGPASSNRLSQPAELQGGAVQIAVGTIPAAPPGDTVLIPIEISNAPDFTGGDFILTYDANRMVATGAYLTALTNDFEIRSNFDQPGILHVSLAYNEPIQANGSIFLAEFKITTDVSSIDFASVRLHDATGRDLQTSALQRDVETTPYSAPAAPTTTPTPTPSPTPTGATATPTGATATPIPNQNMLYLPLTIR